MSTSDTHNGIIEAGGKDRAPMFVAGSPYEYQLVTYHKVPSTSTAPLQREETKMEKYSTVSEDKKMMINAEAEAICIILTRIDDDIYSTLDACANAKEMWIAIKRLMQGENINKQNVETNLIWAFGKFISWDGESLE
ncbi:hypothetical protein Tco_0034661 [Tanacetum coccineum]